MVEQKPMNDNFIKLSENKSDPNKIPEPNYVGTGKIKKK